MTSRTGRSDDDTPLGPTELQALRRLAEPPTQRSLPEQEELWASRYRIKAPIGHGGMGDVFLAQDVLLDRLVALKVLRNTSDESFVDERRLLREARAAARAEHERVARVYDAGTWNDRAFIAMEYVRGETLRAWMKSHRPTMNEIIAIIQQLLEGLQALHERGLVHRDLKPENVMVTPEGSLRILDLGIARRVAIADTPNGLSEATGTLSLGFGVGTPGYMAPEQWRHGSVDARADLFALGVIAYELVTARAPFRGSTNLEIREQTLHAELSFTDAEWADTPPALTTAIREALARDPALRSPNVEHMAATLAVLFRPALPPLSGPRTPSIRPPGNEKAPRFESLAASVVGLSMRALPKRRRPRLLVAGLAATSLVVLSAVILRRPRAHAWPPPPAGMARLGGGSFRAGTNTPDPGVTPPGYSYEVPARDRTVAPFDLDTHEVTNEDFANFLTTIAPSVRVADDDDEHFPRFVRYTARAGDEPVLADLWPSRTGLEKDATGAFHARSGFERLPVTLVTWMGAHLFCLNASKRLPTETEWEFAARGVEGRSFPWGEGAARCEGVHIPSSTWVDLSNASSCDNDRTLPFPVMSGSQDMTPEGIFDLAGNVVEWVDTVFKEGLEEELQSSRLQLEQPVVIRGGAYNKAFLARATTRSHRLAFNVAFNVGFRCAKTITGN